MEDSGSTRRHIDSLLRRRRCGEGVAGALEGLCRVMSDELALAGAVVTLMPSIGAHVISAASSPAVRKVEAAQFGVGEGPTRDAFTSRRPVLVAELAVAGVRRWPGWAPTALAAEVAAVYALPLHIGASIFGVLTGYAGPGSALDATGLEAALMFSDSATELLVDGTQVDGHGLEPVLDASLAVDGYIYQAQGKVMVELGVSLPEALARMRAHAWATGQELTALARDILEGRTMPKRDPR